MEQQFDFEKYIDKLRRDADKLVIDSLYRSFPIEGENYVLKIRNVRFLDPVDRPYDEEKDAILSRRSLYRRLEGEIDLIDKKTGQPIYSWSGIIGAVPYITRRGTLIINGREYAIPNQIRLAPAIYLRRTADGRYEAYANMSYENRFYAHRIFYDPETGVINLDVGRRSIPIVTVMRLMGIPDSVIKKTLGDYLYRVNVVRDTAKRRQDAIKVLASKVNMPESADPHKVVLTFFSRAKYDPYLTSLSLRVPQSQLSGAVTPNDFLLVLDRLLKVSKGEAMPSDRDHLAFQQIYTPAHQIAQMTTNAAITLGRTIVRRIPSSLKRGQTKTIDKYRIIIPPTLVEKYLRSTNLLQNLEEVNPLEVADQVVRVVRTGQGGIGSVEAIPYSAREVHYSHAGVLDPIRTSESLTAGADLRLTIGAWPGRGKSISMELINARTGRRQVLTTRDIYGKVIAFPRHPDDPPGMRAAFVNGRILYVPEEKVDFYIPSPDHLFSPIGNLVPMRSTVSAIRLNMGSKFYTQAVPLVNRETPLVSSSDSTGNPYHRKMANFAGAVFSKHAGTVVEVDKNKIVVRDPSGQDHVYWLYQDFPYNRSTYIYNEPKVRVGDVVKPGQLLADSNFTNDGELATGINAKVAFIAWKGLTHEDAFVVSESFAKKMASEHLFDFRSDGEQDLVRKPGIVMGLSPNKYDRQFVQKYIDEDGVVKPGTIVRKGDPLIMQARQTIDPDFKVRQRAVRSFRDETEVWEYSTPGIVTDVKKNPDGSVVVLVKSVMPLKVGDKIADRFGTKGVVSAVIPDEQMPKDENGEPFEVIVDPAAVYSRMNPGQILEAYLGAVAKKRGQPYYVSDMDKNWYEFVKKEMEKYGVKPTGKIIDPTTGKMIEGVGMGYKYFLRLKQKAEDYIQGRATGEYSAEGLPSTAAEDERAKRAGWQELNAILAHGATDVLWDMRMVRGQENADFWRAFQLGKLPTLPRVPFVWQKFVEMARAGGINIKQVGDRWNIFALTGEDVEKLAGNRVIENSGTVDWQTLKPVRGGLFDINITGGHDGTLWAKIPLPHPYPNPVMEPVLLAILGLNRKEFEQVLAGRHKLPDGSTGPEGLYEYVSKLDLDQLIKKFEAEAKSRKGAARDKALKALSWLKNTKRVGMHPKDWFWRSVPVLPPIYRPISIAKSMGAKIIADPNYLYRDLIEVVKAHKAILDAGGKGRKSALMVYLAMKALAGLGEPVNPQTRKSRIKGIIPYIFGREGYVDKRLFRTYVDLAGRAVIVPDPSLNMDEVAIPEEMAWKIFRPFIIRRLVLSGMKFIQALDAYEKRTDEARHALLEEMKHRPVIMSRSPILHKFGMLAHWAKLSSDNTIHMPLLPLKGYAADFDGDQMNVHVPVTEAARKEAIEKMLPSRNLIDPRNYKPIFIPRLDLQYGLYRAANPDPEKINRPPVYYNKRDDMLNDLIQGKIDIDQPVVIVNDG